MEVKTAKCSQVLRCKPIFLIPCDRSDTGKSNRGIREGGYFGKKVAYC
jgi:hypothetical protein